MREIKKIYLEGMMQTSVIGFPRIGTLRELKFASEKYFKKEIETEELLQTAETLRKTHWSIQKEAGIFASFLSLIFYKAIFLFFVFIFIRICKAII